MIRCWFRLIILRRLLHGWIAANDIYLSDNFPTDETVTGNLSSLSQSVASWDSPPSHERLIGFSDLIFSFDVFTPICSCFAWLALDPFVFRVHFFLLGMWPLAYRSCSGGSANGSDRRVSKDKDGIAGTAVVKKSFRLRLVP